MSHVLLRALATLSILAPLASVAQAQDDAYSAVRERLNSCFACHGEKGVPSDPQYPILGGQEFYYLYVQIKDYNSGLRASEVMGPMVANLDKKEMQALAKYFSEQPWPEPSGKTEISQQDEETARQAITSLQCIACHLGTFRGNSRVPRLAGQHQPYLQSTMLNFKSRARSNAPDMSALLETLSEGEIASLARYLAAMP